MTKLEKATGGGVAVTAVFHVTDLRDRQYLTFILGHSLPLDSEVALTIEFAVPVGDEQ